MKTKERHKLLFGYLELTKPRILTLVLITTSLGYFLPANGVKDVLTLLKLLFGVSCVCAGSAALNHYLERESDRKMKRTRNRPLPSGLIAPAHALNFGIILILTGVFSLLWHINLLTAFLSLLTAFLYVLVYTPLKKVSWWNTSIGAIPGALPPMGGWAAATGELSAGAWVLFFILFLWQHPHFYSIAWMFREDYERGGFKMLPVLYPDGRRTFAHIIFFSVLLIPVSLLPSYLGISGRLYFCGAILLGMIVLQKAFILRDTHTHADARLLLRATVIYLPILFLLILVDGYL